MLREQHVGCGAAGGMVVQVPGGLYGGRIVYDQVLEDALQPGAALDRRFEELGARHLAKPRCLPRTAPKEDVGQGQVGKVHGNLPHAVELHGHDARQAVNTAIQPNALGRPCSSMLQDAVERCAVAQFGALSCPGDPGLQRGDR